MIYKQIQTTWAKAKEASAFADRMVQIAKDGSLHSRRLLISKMGNSQIANQLITQIAPHFKERKGGYTRVLRMGTRVGDRADMALLEFTATIEAPKKPKKEKTAKKPEVKEATKHVEEKPKKESRKEEKKAPSAETAEEKKEASKKGGFLSGLRKFFKGDDEPSK